MKFKNIVGALILLAALGAGLILVKQNQETRRGASYDVVEIFSTQEAVSLGVGKRIKVPIMIDSKSHRLAAVDLSWKFDPKIIKVTNIDLGISTDQKASFFRNEEEVIDQKTDNTLGWVRLTGVSLETEENMMPSGVKKLMTIEIEGVARGESKFDLDVSGENVVAGYTTEVRDPKIGFTSKAIVVSVGSGVTKEPLPAVTGGQGELTPTLGSGSCSDSDGGKNTGVTGEVKTSAGVYRDSCTSCSGVCTEDGVCGSCGAVNEYYCDSTGNGQKTIVKCVNGCEGGRCLTVTTTPTSTGGCTDSDGGKNPTKYGEVKVGGVTYKDGCNSCTGACSGTDDSCNTSCGGMTEYYCDQGKVASYQVECEGNCNGGVCQPKIGVPTTLTPSPVPTAMVSCTDTDGGKNYAKRGTVRDANGTLIDTCTSCVNNCAVGSAASEGECLTTCNGLMERYCENNRAKSEVYNCKPGTVCRVGACVAATSLTPTVVPSIKVTPSPTGTSNQCVSAGGRCITGGNECPSGYREESSNPVSCGTAGITKCCIPIGTTITIAPSPTGLPTIASGDCPVCPNGVALKKLGNADCSAKVDFADYAIWRREYFDEGGRGTIAKNDWQANFDCDLTKDKMVTGMDFQRWLDNCVIDPQGECNK
jgi:hypothetical protein